MAMKPITNVIVVNRKEAAAIRQGITRPISDEQKRSTTDSIIKYRNIKARWEQKTTNVVRQEFRDNGIGRVLMDVIIGMADDLDRLTGCLAVVVDPNSDERTLRFYSKNYFEQIASGSKRWIRYLDSVA